MMRADESDWHEWAEMLHRDSGATVGPIVEGERRGVDVRPQLQALNGQPGVSVHTHPGGSSFSDYDAAGLSAGVDVLCVVGADETWFILSAGASVPSPSAGELAIRYAVAKRKLDPTYDALVYIEAMTEAEAWADQSHEMWEQISSATGLRYDRIKPPPS